MLKPNIVRVEKGSSGEKIVDMIASRLRRLSYNMRITSQGDEILVVSQAEPFAMKDYFFPTEKRRQVKELIRSL